MIGNQLSDKQISCSSKEIKKTVWHFSLSQGKRKRTTFFKDKIEVDGR